MVVSFIETTLHHHAVRPALSAVILPRLLLWQKRIALALGCS
jgi:hypothetical protein